MVATLVIIGIAGIGLGALAMTAPGAAATGARIAVTFDKPPADHLLAARDAEHDEPPDDRTVLAFRGLDHDVIRVIDGWHPVESATTIQSETLGVTRVTTAAGHIVLDLADGFRIPLAAVFIDPATHAAVVHDGDPAVAAALEDLAPGTVLLSTTGARLRGVEEGARLRIVAQDHAGHLDMTVVGVVSDGWARRGEILVHTDDAARLGLADDPRSLVVVHRGGDEATRTIIGRITRLTGQEPHTTVLHPVAPGPSLRLVLSLPEIKERFGEFAYRPRRGVREIDVHAEYAESMMVTTEVPIIGEVRCHRLIIEDLVAALEEMIAAGIDDWLDPRRYAGCHYPRRISTDRSRLSNHSWGIAIDLNVDLSMPGLGPQPPDEMIEIFGRHGFRWGGDFSQPDHHHWEWVGDHASHRPAR